MVIQCEDGSTTMESPVCTPTGSMFSIPQMVMAWSVPSRINLEFDFLIALYALFYQNLMHRGKLQRMLHDFHQFSFVIGKAAACAAQCEMAGRSTTG